MRSQLTCKFLLSAILLAIPFAIDLPAQTTASGGLTGIVTDPSGAVVPDANVEIKVTAKGTLQKSKTDRAGVYRFSFLAPGQFTLRVEHSGFREDSRTVNIPSGAPVSVNVTLAIAKAAAAVTVTQEAQVVQAENGDVSTTGRNVGNPPS